MFKLFFITIFFNIKLIEIFKSFLSHILFFLLHWNIISLLFLITQKITKRLTTDRLNMINDFLTKIEDYNIIILSKLDLDDELIKINTL